jgi:hypothetical protein
MGLSKEKEKEFAKIIYLADKGIKNKDLALRVGVSEKTVGKWIVEGGWEALQTSLITTRQGLLMDLHNQLAALNEEIKSNGNIPTKDQSTISTQISNNIKKLETEASIGECFVIGQKAMSFIQEINLDDAKLFTKYFDEFLNSILKSK